MIPRMNIIAWSSVARRASEAVRHSTRCIFLRRSVIRKTSIWYERLPAGSARYWIASARYWSLGSAAQPLNRALSHPSFDSAFRRRRCSPPNCEPYCSVTRAAICSTLVTRLTS